MPDIKAGDTMTPVNDVKQADFEAAVKAVCEKIAEGI